MVKKGVIAAASALALLSGCSWASSPPETGVVFLMDTVVEYKLYGDNAAKAAQEIQRTLSDFENRVSNYLPDSEISKLNAGAGHEAVALSQDTFDLLARSISFCGQSDGSFDITIEPLTRLWDVTNDAPHVPEKEKIDALLPLVDFRNILLDAGKKTAKLAKEGQSVDLGGVGKGYATDLARQAAIDCGITSGYVSIGGNLMVIGQSPPTGLFGTGAKPFVFTLRDPRGGAKDAVAQLLLKDTTITTSGDYERYFIDENGVRYHHILDPMTGYPANAGLMSVSIITPDGALGDYLSTSLFVRGREYALNHINDLGCGIILIDTDMHIYVSKDLESVVKPLDTGGKYTFEVVK